MKRILFSIPFLFITSLFALVVNPPIEKKTTSFDRGTIITEAQFLYFRSFQKGLALTNAAKPIATTTNFANDSLKNPKFYFQPGFKVALGYGFHNPWKIKASYLRLHQRANRSNTPPFETANFPIWSFGDSITSSSFVTSSKMDWKLALNRIDLLGSYSFSFPPWITLIPIFGLENAYIDQNMNYSYQGGIFSNGKSNTSMINNYFGIGPKIGIIPSFTFGRGVSLVGRATASYYMGEFYIHQKQKYLSNTIFSKNSSYYQGRWNTDLGIYLNYQTNPLTNKIVFSASGGYEYFVFFNQYQLQRGPIHFFSDNHNLKLYGWNLKLKVEF